MEKLNSKSIIHVIKYLFLDGTAILVSYLLSIWIFDAIDVMNNYEGLILALVLIIPAKLAVYALMGVYSILTKHTGFEDIIKIIGVAILTNLVIVLFIFFMQAEFMFKSAYVFITLIEVALLIIPRVLRRFYRNLLYRYKWLKNIGARTLIIGAGSAGELTILEIYKNKDLNNIPIAFVDDNPDKVDKKLMGVNIVGTLDDIEAIIDKYRIEEAIISIKELSQEKFNELVNRLIKKHIRIRRFNALEEVSNHQKAPFVDVKVEDLLNRDVVNLDNQGINALIKDQVVLVTGGGGSIGSELCRQIFELEPKKLIIFDIYENNAYDIQMELLRKVHKNPKIKYPELIVRIGSVYNQTRLEGIFKTFNPNLVFHAAAYKHVPLMEDSAVEAVRTNVIGTYHTAHLSAKYGVKKFVLVSSDKAVRATNVMGATKRFAELIIEALHSEGNATSFSAVRFGNVLGSNGSVIPLFKKQIEDGGPITVTHKDITRYFMTIPEAVGLILQCSVYAGGGDLFVLDMGEPVKIYDLAIKMIKLAGHRPFEDIDVEIVGLRPGEKLYEELLLDMDSEEFQKTDNKKIFKEHTDKCTLDLVKLEKLAENFESLTNEEIKLTVSEIVDSYNFKKE